VARAALGRWQAAVYAAEQEALVGVGRRWRRLGEAQDYADRLVESEWFAARWGHFVACAVERRGRGSRWSLARCLEAGPGGRANEGVVLLAPQDLCQRAFLHELSHLLVPPGSGHGPAFIEVHLELVRRELGFVAYADYRAALGRRLGELGEGVA